MRLFIVNGIMLREREDTKEVGSYCYRVVSDTEETARVCATRTFIEEATVGGGWNIASMNADDVTDFALTFARAELARVEPAGSA